MWCKRDSLKGKRIWLTGASSGIGYALAKVLASEGARLILSGRNEQKLSQLKASLKTDDLLILPFDVTSLQANKEAAAKIKARWGGLDIAIFNAGQSAHINLNVDDFDSSVFTHLMAANYFSVMYGIEAALPLLARSTKGLIAATSSVAAYAGMPQGEAYSATKAALTNVLQGLRIDLKPKGIDVTIISPGFIKTPMTANHKFPMPFILTAPQAAKIITKGLKKRRQEIHFPWRMSLAMKLLGMLPSPLYTWIMTKIKLKS